MNKIKTIILSMLTLVSCHAIQAMNREFGMGASLLFGHHEPAVYQKMTADLEGKQNRDEFEGVITDNKYSHYQILVWYVNDKIDLVPEQVLLLVFPNQNYSNEETDKHIEKLKRDYLKSPTNINNGIKILALYKSELLELTVEQLKDFKRCVPRNCYNKFKQQEAERKKAASENSARPSTPIVIPLITPAPILPDPVLPDPVTNPNPSDANGDLVIHSVVAGVDRVPMPNNQEEWLGKISTLAKNKNVLWGTLLATGLALVSSVIKKKFNKQLVQDDVETPQWKCYAKQFVNSLSYTQWAISDMPHIADEGSNNDPNAFNKCSQLVGSLKDNQKELLLEAINRFDQARS